MCINFRQTINRHCRLCRAPALAELALCRTCLDSLPHLRHACPRCALPLDEGTPPDSLCGECLADPPAFDQARVALRYRQPVNDLVSGFKYHQRLSDGRLVAQLLARHVQQQAPDIELLLPMPLHPGRLRERGYNQAAELARVLSSASRIDWNSHLLKRTREASSQREANKRDRLRNVRSAFECAAESLPKRVAIIDDVITTGATARAAAASVKKAGADWVEIWAVARTPKPGET